MDDTMDYKQETKRYLP